MRYDNGRAMKLLKCNSIVLVSLLATSVGFSGSFVACAKSSEDPAPADDGGIDAAEDVSVDTEPSGPSNHELTVSTCDDDRQANEVGKVMHRTIKTNGESRSFELFRPAGAKCGQKSGLLVLLHPKHTTAEVGSQPAGAFYLNASMMQDHATSGNFIVVAPNALKSGSDYVWSLENKKDAEFIRDLAEAVGLKEPVDTKKIHVIGYGEGGQMAMQVGCDHASIFASTGSIAGGMAASTKASCDPSESISALQIHVINKDAVFPYAGDDSTASFVDTRSFWVDKNGCTTSSNKDLGGAAQVTYTACGGKQGLVHQTIVISSGDHKTAEEYVEYVDDFIALSRKQ